MRSIGRYVLHDEIAVGGMGAVHLGRAYGSAGFARIVVIKRLHPHLAANPEAVAAFSDEARLSARVRHPNVVATLDVVDHERELLLVMDYVHGGSLSTLVQSAARGDTKAPVAVAVAIALDVLRGLQAVHEATNETGEPLHIVHRDISPQNILVGTDGIARVADFGIAKAAERLQTTTLEGAIKGKLRYMAPEQLMNLEADPRTDEYSTAVVLWELLAGRPLFRATNDGGLVALVLEGVVIPPSRHSPEISAELERVVMRGLSRRPGDRYASCDEMAGALRAATAPAASEDVARWVQESHGEALRERAARVAQIETGLADEDGQPRSAREVATITADSTPKTRRGGRMIVLLAAVALTVAVATAAAFVVPSRASTAVVTSAAPSAPASIVASPTPPAASVGHETTPEAIAPAPIPTPVPSASRAIAPKRATVPASSSRPARRSGCNPMFTVDENGIRRIKPECL